MLPVALNVKALKILVVGEGSAITRRLEFLEEAGAKHVTHVAKWQGEDIASFQLVLVADIPYEEATPIADAARSANVLINVEDERDLCDFYYSSMVRRGDLLLAVNTAGQSPTLSKRIRLWLEEKFPPVWQERLQTLGQLRNQWKAENADFKELMKKSNDYIDEQQWLKH